MQSDVELFGTEKVDMKYCDVPPFCCANNIRGA